MPPDTSLPASLGSILPYTPPTQNGSSLINNVHTSRCSSFRTGQHHTLFYRGRLCSHPDTHGHTDQCRCHMSPQYTPHKLPDSSLHILLRHNLFYRAILSTLQSIHPHNLPSQSHTGLTCNVHKLTYSHRHSDQTHIESGTWCSSSPGDTRGDSCRVESMVPHSYSGTQTRTSHRIFPGHNLEVEGHTCPCRWNPLYS